MRKVFRSSGWRRAIVVPALSSALVVLLAASWLVTGDLVTRIPPLLVAAGRTGAAFLVLMAAAMMRPAHRAETAIAATRLTGVILLGFLGFAGYYAGTMIGTGMIGASRVGLITSLLPCITFIIGAAAFDERVTCRRIFGTLLALLGACGYALADSPVGGGSGDDLATLAGGALLAFAGTASYALYGYMFRHRMRGLSALGSLPPIMAAGTLMLAIAVLLFVPTGGIALSDWVRLAALGAILTAPVFLLLHALILRKGPLFTAGLTLLVPLLLRLGEWGLGRIGPPNFLVLSLLGVCAAGVWLTIGGRVDVAARS